MNFTFRRLDAMDAQRFDPSKKSRNPSNLVISIVAPSVHGEESGIPQITVIAPEFSALDETWIANQFSSATDDSPSSATVIEATIFNYTSHTQLTDVFENDGYTTTRTIIRPASPRSPLRSLFSGPSIPVSGATSRSTSSPLCDRFANLNSICGTDAFEGLDLILRQHENDLSGVTEELQVKDGYTTMPTIIHPASSRPPIRSLFSRPSSPVSGATSRASSPLCDGFKFANLNCICRTDAFEGLDFIEPQRENDPADAFEKRLDFIVQQRENNLAGATNEIQVKVTENQVVSYEERRRDSIQAILYEQPPIVSCVGYLY
ncbi:hypothetical protein BYT27DRAFT_7257383 [Phlegmacium glaucopus]|nr:hypothetical protein BYT27DRAFT_7257383 [Phlegmacium glaucopus]